MGHSLSAQAGGAVRAWTLGELFARAGLKLSHPNPDSAVSGTSIPNTDIAVSGTPIPNPDVVVSDIVDDSRAVTPGACFVAVPGATADGRRFVEDAVRRGASVVVIERGHAEPDEASPSSPEEPEILRCAQDDRSATFIEVSDAREAVARLSAAFYGLLAGGTAGERGAAARARWPKVIGVTGTNGKTTVTWMLRSIFRAAGVKAGLLGTVEYDTGGGACAAPLTTPGPVELCRHMAAARAAGVKFMSLEVSSHALDQKRTDGLEFAAAVFTNLTGDHLDYHGTKEAYFAAKRRLFERLAPGAVAVINADDAMAEPLRASTKALVITYSVRERILAPATGGVREGILAPATAPKNAAADVYARGIAAGRSGSRFTLCTAGSEMLVHLPLVGEHNISNALAAAAAAEALGVDLKAIRAGLESLGGVAGRLQRVEPEGCPFSVLVDYAHTDDALRNVLRAVRPITPGRIICVFGCGGNRDRSKRPRMAAAVEELADVAVVTSDNPRQEEPEAIIEEILSGFKVFAPHSSGLGERIQTPNLFRTPKALTPALSQGEREKSGEIIVEVDRREAIGRALSAARAGDTVLIAGKGHENYQLVGDRVLDFDDVEVARGFLESMTHGEHPVANARENAGLPASSACGREVCA